MAWTIEIPDYHPPTLNQLQRARGGHWASEAVMKRQAANVIGCYALGIPKARKGECRRVSLRLTGWKSGRLPDRDAWDKCLLDALVTCGLLYDDDEAHLEGRVEVTYERSAKRSTTITLDDCG